MALAIYPKEQALLGYPNARLLLEYLINNAQDLSLDGAHAFCNFPFFKEEGTVLSAPVVLVSPDHGVVLFGTDDDSAASSAQGLQEAAEVLEATFSQVFSRLMKYPRLRRGRKDLAFPIDAMLFIPEAMNEPVALGETAVAVGASSIGSWLADNTLAHPIANDVVDEILSVIDGSKALIKPRLRELESFPSTSRVARIAALEDEIRRFDREQRTAYMSEVHGPQRIRGLAGSGKTVVLAMKAALTHLRNPDAAICFTFFTKSLYQHVRNLITRFYRLVDDKDPDWKKLMVMHAWGGGMVEGMYSYAASMHGISPLNFSQARAFDPQQPFGYACRRLNESISLRPIFDFIFVDEAQDFPPSFLRLALRLAHEERLVIAYDALQTIFDVEIPTSTVLFGTDETGEPAVQFEEDVVLTKCYRNPREILLCAHALGFGIYGPRVVQMLESKEHWEDFGYKVLEGDFVSGRSIVIERPVENSPSSISQGSDIEEIISCSVFPDFNQEVEFVVSCIARDIQVEGVPPEDILVVCADDRNTKAYFREISRLLTDKHILSHNLQEDSFGIREFQSDKKVTLSTVYKAKGNEAYVVYLIGIDALFYGNSAKRRNMVFTAMTRAKGWLTVTGLGEYAEKFSKELSEAKSHFPKLEFTFPDPQELVVMKRDLQNAQSEVILDLLRKLNDEFADDDLEEVLKIKLAELKKRKKTGRISKKWAGG